VYISSFDDYSKAKRSLEKLEYQCFEHCRLKNLNTKYANKINFENRSSLLTKAKNLFFLPFNKDAFSTLFQTAVTLLLTFVFSGISPIIFLSIVFCAIIDVAYVVVYVALFPLILVFCFAMKPVKIAHYNASIRKTEKLLVKYDIYKINDEINKLRDGIKEYERSLPIGDSDADDIPVIVPQNGTNSPLSPLSTDTTLDLHPGDY